MLSLTRIVDRNHAEDTCTRLYAKKRGLAINMPRSVNALLSLEQSRDRISGLFTNVCPVLDAKCSRNKGGNKLVNLWPSQHVDQVEGRRAHRSPLSFICLILTLISFHPNLEITELRGTMYNITVYTWIHDNLTFRLGDNLKTERITNTNTNTNTRRGCFIQRRHRNLFIALPRDFFEINFQQTRRESSGTRSYICPGISGVRVVGSGSRTSTIIDFRQPVPSTKRNL